jgi:predicted glycosyltransferase
MNVLFDIVHPADVLFFRDVIKRLRSDGASVVIASRHKDITCQLLDELNEPHTPLSTAGGNLARHAIELITRDLRLAALARRIQPDVMVGFGGIAISHVGRLLGIPSISFYDTEDARLQISLTCPFITEWHVPTYWHGPEAKGRTFRFNGFKELAYLHPERFQPRLETAIQLGLAQDRDNFFVRWIAWAAAHDAGKQGWGERTLRDIVHALSSKGKVHLSAEGPVPDELKPLLYRGPLSDIHHIIANCRLFIGESATMAAEAALLGVPAICSADYDLGYLSELAAANLVTQVSGGSSDILACANSRLQHPPAHWGALRDKAVAGRINVADYIYECILRLAPTL